MKKSLVFCAAMLVCILVSAQAPSGEYRFVEASELNLIGKLFPDTPNPYHRVDTVRFKGFTTGENIQVRCPAGMAVLFKTNSSSLSVKTVFGSYERNAVNTMGISYRGYDLYIRKDGKWLWAASGATPQGTHGGDNKVLIKDMDSSEKECMLYLPIYSEVYSVQIGVDPEAEISAMESPFSHRIAIFGSSFTQGISTSRPGMSYPMQLSRNTGLQILSLGCSGNCKMQPYFADVLCAADVDAIIFDSFSNPDAKLIRKRLFPFIERIQAAHPDIPLIFQQTIYREGRNFSLKKDRVEREKQETAAELMKEAVKKYKNVYFITTTNATSESHETSVDGTHPNDYGYMLWAESIEKPLLKILRKYGIRPSR
ncbi:MAG: SGNH/GDSL hydrolase family protein [Candidatus Cryptobacteroides sp.]